MLLLINDHVLKHTSPSWLTGKLSDFAGLVFAPFLVIAVIACFGNRRMARHAKNVGLLVFGLTGVAFSLIKATPLFNTLAIELVRAVTGVQIAIVLDPSDLIALLALLVGWWIWLKPDYKVAVSQRRGWAMLLLGAFASIATSPPQMDYGVSGLCGYAEIVLASSLNFTFISRDGGLTWEEADRDIDLRYCKPRGGYQELTDPTNPRIRYRVDPQQMSISRSDDEGQTWIPQIDWHEELSEAQLRYKRRQAATKTSLDYYTAFPQAVLIHGRTGNVVVAMGHSGVLVRLPTGIWQWASVGPYERTIADSVAMVMTALSGEFWLSLALIPLVFATMTDYVSQAMGHTGWLALSWIFWIVPVFFLTPGYVPPGSFLNFSQFGYAFIAVCTMIVLFLAIEGIHQISDQGSRAATPMFIFAIIAACLFILPYILWTRAVISRYELAQYIGTGAAILTSVIGHRYLVRIARVGPKNNKKEKPKQEAETPSA